MLSFSQVLGVALAVVVLLVLASTVQRDGFHLAPGALWFDGQPEARSGAAQTWLADRPIVREELRVATPVRRSVRVCRVLALTFTALADRIEEHDARVTADAAPRDLVDRIAAAWQPCAPRRKAGA